MTVEYTQDYLSWIDNLTDHVGRLRILKRVERLAEGNPGLHRYLGKGVYELKIDVGPGYRIYYSKLTATNLVVLFGGDKGSQTKDIAKAIELRRQY